MKKTLILLTVFFYLAVSPSLRAQQISPENLQNFQTAIQYIETNNASRAIPILKKLAAKGETMAYSMLGGLYYEGAPGVPRDPQLGINYLRKAAGMGEVTAQNILRQLRLRW